MESLVRMLASWKSFTERECAVWACQSCSHSLGMSELRVRGPASGSAVCAGPRGSVPGEGYGVLALNTAAALKQGSREAD